MYVCFVTNDALFLLTDVVGSAVLLLLPRANFRILNAMHWRGERNNEAVFYLHCRIKSSS
jgi:hypothetical protein